MARKNKVSRREARNAMTAALAILSFGTHLYVQRLELLMCMMIASFIGGWGFGLFWTKRGNARKSGARKTKQKDIFDSTPGKLLSDQELLTRDIDSLSGLDFERLVEMYYRDKGYPVKRIGGSGDHGVDIIVQEKDGAWVAVQCKRQMKNVGNAVVLKLDSGRRAHQCHVGRIITTAYFTREAEDAAKRLRIELYNRMVTLDKLESWRKKQTPQGHKNQRYFK